MEINSQKIYWLLNVGIPKRKITDYELVANNFNQIQPPIFFLSTGRTATKWFANLLKKAKKFAVYHEPFPVLAFQAKFIFSLLQKHQDYSKILTIAQQIFLTARTEYLHYAYLANKQHLETNNHITFFAPAIYSLLPKTKFVHLIRHPKEFVISGLKRGWYAPNNPKISKLPEINEKWWQKLSQIEKIAWLWKETNEFIENFKLQIPDNQIITINISNLNPSTIEKLTQFLNLKLTKSYITRKLKHKANQSPKQIQINWTTQMDKQILPFCQKLCEKYKFEF